MRDTVMTAVDKSQQDLIDEGQALVYSLASRAHRSVPVRVDLDDLIAYGQLGLAEAAREYDPEKGAQFTTFAYYRVRGAIYDGLSKMSWASRAQYKRMRYQQQANEALRANESSASDNVEKEASWLRGTAEKLGVVFFAANKNDEKGIRESSLEDPGATPSSQVMSRELNQKLHDVVTQLPNAERRLIETIYYEGLTLQEAANRLGISKSWASRLHAKTLDQMARTLRKIGAD